MKNLLYLCALSLLPIFSTGTGCIQPSYISELQEEAIHPKDLPQNIRKHLTENYNGAKIIKALKKADGYFVTINYQGEKMTLKYNLKGEFVSKS